MCAYTHLCTKSMLAFSNRHKFGHDHVQCVRIQIKAPCLDTDLARARSRCALSNASTCARYLVNNLPSSLRTACACTFMRAHAGITSTHFKVRPRLMEGGGNAHHPSRHPYQATITLPSPPSPSEALKMYDHCSPRTSLYKCCPL